MMTKIEEIKQIALKSRVYMMAALAICLLIGICFVLFYQPKIKVDDKGLIESKERERAALELQRKAFELLVLQQNKRIVELTNRDSTLLERVIINGDAIKKIKMGANENVKRFDVYGSNDWAQYFAALPEPGQFADSE